MTLVLALIVLTVVVLGLLLLPLLHRWHTPAERPQFDRAVYHAQLEELDRDVGRGLITGRDLAAARLEIERRLLAADAAPQVATARLGSSRSLAIATALIIAGGAGSAYLYLGSPGTPDVPFAERHEAAPAQVTEQAELASAAATLAAKLQANPSDGPGWLLYARTQSELGAWQASADAYAHAVALGQNAPEVLAGQGEMLVLAADGIVGPGAHAAFAQALQGDPKNQIARYYLALGDAQAGEPHRAIQAWQALAAELPDGAPMRDAIAQHIAAVANAAGIAPPALPKGQQDADADVAPSQREQMVRSMVAQLAAHMAETPGDLDGWLRLGRSYAVLGELDKAADAYAHAEALKPNDVDIELQEIGALLNGHAASATIPPHVVALLKQVQAVAPDRPEVLWYLGLVAMQNHQRDEAKRYWLQLAALLPADSDEHKMVASALQAIDTK